MNDRALALLLAAAVLVALVAGVLLATSAAPPPARQRGGEEYQRLVFGLGLGAPIDLSRCAAAFDPRDGSACSVRFEPVPCGDRFCPAHARN
jgi:hypothetical protein